MTCWRRTVLGMGFDLRSFRRSHSSPGVSKTMTCTGIPDRWARSIHPARRLTSKPRVSTTVVKPRLEPFGDDSLQDLECGSARPLVVLPGADQGPEPVGGDDFLGPEVVLRPSRLPRSGGSDQHDEARGGETQLHGTVLVGRSVTCRCESLACGPFRPCRHRHDHPVHRLRRGRSREGVASGPPSLRSWLPGAWW